jgi:molecular chaperone GrpE
MQSPGSGERTMGEGEETRRTDFEGRIAHLRSDFTECSKTVEGALDKLSGLKGELNSMGKELERIREMLADEAELTEEKLDAIGDAVEILEEELAAKRKELVERSQGKEEEYRSQLQYLRADFENYKRRAEKDKRDYADFCIECFVKDLLPVKEALEAAIGHASANNNSRALVKGVELTVKQLNELLLRAGLAEIKAEGEQFDPYQHEVAAKEHDDAHPANTILEVLRKGYSFRGKVIRPAVVKLAVTKEAGNKEGAIQ